MSLVRLEIVSLGWTECAIEIFVHAGYASKVRPIGGRQYQRTVVRRGLEGGGCFDTCPLLDDVRIAQVRVGDIFAFRTLVFDRKRNVAPKHQHERVIILRKYKQPEQPGEGACELNHLFSVFRCSCAHRRHAERRV